MSASVRATACARAPADARANGARLMELENAMAIRRPPLLEHPAQREANSSTWPDALTLTALATLCRNSWLRLLRAGTSSMEMTKMPDLDRRRFLGSAAATVAAGQLGVLAFSRRLEAMTQPITEVPLETGSVRSDIRPFHVSFPEEQLTDLPRRIKATKWPAR